MYFNNDYNNIDEEYIVTVGDPLIMLVMIQ